jgi:hypothetical protein
MTATVFPFPNTQTASCRVCADVWRVKVTAPGFSACLVIGWPTGGVA